MQLRAFQKDNARVVASHTLEVDKYIEAISNLMSHDSYDSAYQLATAALSFADTTTYNEGKYYLHAFNSEILYYNSSFDPALNSSYRALKYAQALKNDTLIGSIQNLIGLVLSNLGQYNDAESELRTAIQMLPFNHGNPNLSYRFHAASNLCGIFLHKQQADSALHYARLSLNEASALKRYRAMAIDYWNIAKAHVIYKDFDSAFYYIQLGKSIAHEGKIADVQLFFTAIEADVLLRNQQKTSSIALIKSGMENLTRNEELTVFSKIDFLNDAVNIAIEANEYALAAQAQVILKKLKDETDKKRNAEQIKVLERFYASEKQLELSESQWKKQEAEAKLNRLALYSTVGIGIFVLLVVALLIFVYMQKQNINLLRLENEKKAIEAQKEKEKITARIDAANAERNRIAKELHDDIGSSLSSIAMYTDIALRSADSDYTKSIELLKKVNEKSRELTENMSDIVWAVYSKNDTFNNLVMRMKNFAFEMAAPLDVEIDFHYPFQLDDLVLNAEQRKNVYYIFKEALNNALKHSNSKRIAVLMEDVINNRIRISIIDNGSGFDIDTIKKNNGYYNMQARAKAISGVAVIRSGKECGTSVIVEFPISY